MTYYAPAKVNIFLKITGRRGDYHTLRSRFVRLKEPVDTIHFIPSRSTGRTFRWRASAPLPETNTLTRAYELLLEVNREKVERFFDTHTLFLDKAIPTGAGLGGGSSDAATFLKACNEEIGLKLSTKKLAAIGEKIGADVPFFIYDYPSANVEGIGEIIHPFDEEPPALSLVTPPVHCDTAKVYGYYRTHLLSRARPDAGKKWLQTPSRELLATLSPEEANDLYLPAKVLYPELAPPKAGTWFLSGSGSTFFQVAL
ncbi:MAG: 4-(cytidine 5'-diphospho)-2-C-methyl-D-erythritol kinase [Epsilonproteobacteria bacterium]|nr:4-(cytidine 5'-diphospho)-2-C-methyl-D-erythritol kinase [Campylobacterota bacterium]